MPERPNKSKTRPYGRFHVEQRTLSTRTFVGWGGRPKGDVKIEDFAN